MSGFHAESVREGSPPANLSIARLAQAGLVMMANDNSAMTFRENDCYPWTAATHQVDALSPRELQVFVLLGAGFSNRRISQTLGVTEFTVKTHVGRVLSKLKLESRLQIGLAALVHLSDLGSRLS
jgi:DNA-binding NarL/FixJ family response regulator